MITCETCGNEIKNFQNVCPFCGSLLKNSGKKYFKIEIINLEKGYPTVAEAKEKLFPKLSKLYKQGINVIKIIHGYGSSGVGGKLRNEIRKSLYDYKFTGSINFIVLGENFKKKDSETKKMIQKYPDLLNDSDFGRGNKGITIVAK